MASLTDEDEDDDDEITEEFAQDGAAPSNKKVQAKELKSGRLIGKGRSSIVYETTWRGQSYARKDFLRVPSDIFEREAAVLAELDSHPNVTRTHCWSVNEGSCSLVMDLMDDDLQNMMRNRRESAWRPSDDISHVIDLHRFIEDAKKKNAPEVRPVASTLVSSFSMSEALHLMLQIAEGVVFLHEHGVAHGDLKPKNILVAENERGGPSLKVVDFGLVATKMKSKTLVSQRAQKLEIARWRAPELFDKSYLLREDCSDSDWDSDSDGGKIHAYGKLLRADVYSFAITSAQILTGEDPYTGASLRELVSKISGHNGLRPGLPQRCPAQLSDLIIRCWGDELKRPTFIDIRRELKDLQASLTSDSYVDIRKTTITGPDFEVTLSVKFISEKFAKKRYSETSAPTLPRGDMEIIEAVGLPIKKDTYSTKSNEVLSSKLALVPKRRRRRKGHGCLPIRRKEKDDITALKKGIAKAAVSKKSPFQGEATSPNDKQYNAGIGRVIGAKPFTYAEVTTMTRNFKVEIGRGGFGSVYYGKLPDRREVGVKVGTSRRLEQEFFNEFEFLSRVRHKNLVALVGYCQEENYRILIYEYMENGSLYDHLHGNRKRAGMLDWKRRLRIALNVAQGLEYLHTGCEQSFVHGDMKSSNILLSSKYDAKVTDFGLTKPAGEAILSRTHVDTKIKGTQGYIDPEYYVTTALSPKSDIFSFGIVLLELITGRPVLRKTVSGTTQEYLPDWVRPALQEGDIDMVLDPALKSSVPAPNQEALWKVTDIAMRCVEPKGVHRPILSEVMYVLHQAMNLEGPLDESKPFTSGTHNVPGPSVKQTEPPNPISWNSEYFTKPIPIDKPDLDSPSTRVTYRIRKQRGQKASNCFERLGCILAKFGSEELSLSMRKGNEGVTASTTSTHYEPRPRAQKSRAENVQNIGGAKTYTYAEVTAITRNFKTEIGSGGFGPVYYGKLPSGKEVAVKVGSATSKQGDQEFFNEVDLLSRVHHRNLVPLLGCCVEDRHNILIYEYMENGSLTDHLRGNRKRAGMLDWKLRLRIALNVAQGLEYLHTGCSPPLIHRDVKSMNILLSANYYAKVTDFGLSRSMDVDIFTSPVTTMVMGTAGYLDPEYFMTARLSPKSDIYGFGVVLLELITGRQPIDPSRTDPDRILVEWVRPALQEGDIDMVLDPALKSLVPAPNQEALWKVADLAMRCVEPKAAHRPTIDEVVQELRAAIVLQESLPASSEYCSDYPEIVPESSFREPHNIQFFASAPVTDYAEFDRSKYMRLSSESFPDLGGQQLEVLRELCHVAHSSEEFFLTVAANQWLRTAVKSDRASEDLFSVALIEEERCKIISNIIIHSNVLPYHPYWPKPRVLRDEAGCLASKRVHFPCFVLKEALAEGKTLMKKLYEWQGECAIGKHKQVTSDDGIIEQQMAFKLFWEVLADVVTGKHLKVGGEATIWPVTWRRGKFVGKDHKFQSTFEAELNVVQRL